jgi:hypothetical protein
VGLHFTLDAATVTLVGALGGIKAIAISHPHFYTGMVEWSRAFGGVPIHLHAADRAWIMRPDPAIRLWEGETMALMPGVTLVRCGGHFPGGTVLHWADGAGGRGALCSGDIAAVAPDRKWLTFMRSYPNFIPLSAGEVEGVRSKVMHSHCGFFVIWLVSITAASLRFPSEFATVMVIDAKRNANFRGRLKNCQ